MILLKVRSRDTKDQIIRNAKTVKPSKLFFNESLTPHRASLVYALRQAKKAHPGRVSACGSMDGRVYVWLKPPGGVGNDQKTFVDNREKLIRIFSDIGFDNNEVIGRIRF